GRISIPSWIRRNYNLNTGSEVELVFDIKENIIFLNLGPDGANISTRACGALNAGEKMSDLAAKSGLDRLDKAGRLDRVGRLISRSGPYGGKKRGGL
ncbi:MAG: hypothetical protein HY518_01130, partial [Candidatus Aenigmarchaeota archaeon]|nr:hypothetical protein [Candidatus Aenigmarchaeota archaeon]